MTTTNSSLRLDLESGGSLCRPAGSLSISFAFRAGRRLGCFLLALVVFLLTFISPLNALADGYLFSAHMLQHILLLLIVPALLLLSLPRSLSFVRRPRLLTHPLIGWLAGVGAMWFWHWPTLCNAAVTSSSVSAVQTVSLLVMGTSFGGKSSRRATSNGFHRPPGFFISLAPACLQRARHYSDLCAGYGLSDLHPGAIGSECSETIRTIGDLRLKGSADRRAVHVGSHVFHLSHRNSRSARSLVRRGASSAPVT